MDRRQFLKTAAMTSAGLSLQGFNLFCLPGCREDDPMKAITAAVDTILPADPDIPGDFKASDLGADIVVARKLGLAGQLYAVMLLNRYAKKVSGKTFIDASREERNEAVRNWMMEKDTLPTMEKDILSGMLSLTSIGTFEHPSEEVRNSLYESMGWYDPDDPDGTFRIPCDGYDM